MIWRWILGILLLLGLLFWRLRVGIRTSFGGEAATADLTLGPFHIRLLPAKKGEPAGEKPPKKAKPVKKEARDLTAAIKRLPKPTLSEVKDAVRTLSPACKKALRRTRRSIRVHPFHLSVTIAGREDPAAAAEIYGYAHAAVWTAMPALEQLLLIPDPHVHLGIDFDNDKTRAEGEFGISVRIGTLIAVGVGIGFPTLRWIWRFTRRHRKGDQTQTEEKAPAAGTAA